MIDTDLHGIDSHGIGMLSGYNDWRKTGGIVFDGPITVVSDLPALALVDGGKGLGHPVGTFSMALAIDKPRKLELVRLQFVHLITLGLPDITPEWRGNIV